MNPFKVLKPRGKVVNLHPPQGEKICHNVNCRKLLGKHWKELTLQNGYVASICLLCFKHVCEKGLVYNGVALSPSLLKARK